QWILDFADKEDFFFADVHKLGRVNTADDFIQKHIDEILKHPMVDVEAIKNAQFKIVVDPVNSTGALSVPPLLKALGDHNIVIISVAVTGNFAHNREPLPENLRELCKVVDKQQPHLGIAVDPNVDRLCFVCEDGSLFVEEYTLVAVADHILSHKKGNTVSNLS